jgi:hypothetical protein
MQVNGSGRYELKYVLDRDQYHALVEELASYMLPDPHGGQDGRYLVASLYYDTADYKAYWDKMEGLRFRRKVRVRVYGDQAVKPDTACFVEIKQRTNRTIQKKRVVLSYSSAIALCEAAMDVNGVPETDQTVVEEIKYLSSVLQLQPACIVTYDRLAFIGTERDPGLRVTFDTTMKSRTHDLSLLSQGYAKNRLFLPTQWCIMEIKANGHVPWWLTKLAGKYSCTLRSVSKYCTALEKSLGSLQNQRILDYQPEFGLESSRLASRLGSTVRTRALAIHGQVPSEAWAAK